MENNNITFSELMHNPEEPDRKIVIYESFRQFNYWKEMGFNTRTICEGMLIAVLENCVQGDIDQTRNFLRYAQEKAKHYDEKLLFLIDENYKAMDDEESE